MGESDSLGLISLCLAGISLILSGLLTGLKIRDWVQTRSPSGKLSMRLKHLEQNLILLTFILENTGKKDLKPSFAVFFIEKHKLEHINDLNSVDLLDNLTPCEIAKNIVNSYVNSKKRFKKFGKRIQNRIDKKRIRKVCNMILPNYMKIQYHAMSVNFSPLKSF